MGSRLLFGLLLLATLGCKSVRAIKPTTAQPLALTAAEARAELPAAAQLYAEQPRDLVRVTKAARQWELAARALPEDFTVSWQAAVALDFVAENDSRLPVRLDAAKRAVVLCRHARESQPDRVEGHYWYAVSVGLVADADRAYGLDAVGEMVKALARAMELDERYEFAGPLRLQAILHLRTPIPPASIGSPRKGLKLLQRAVELFPDYPENYLYLAEAWQATGKIEEARTTAQRLIDAPLWPDRQFENAKWKAEAKKLLESLK